MEINADERDKRSLILQGALKVFSAKGFHEAKVEEIAQVAGVGKGTVYEYFSSKDELFKEMLLAGLNKFRLAIVEGVKEQSSVKEKLFKVFLVNYNFALEHKENFALFMEAHRGIKEDLHQWMIQANYEVIRLVEGIMQEGILSGEFRTVNVNLAAQVFLGAVRGLTACCMFEETPPDPKQTFDQAMDLLLKGLSV